MDSWAKEKFEGNWLIPLPYWKLLIIIGFFQLVNSKVRESLTVRVSPLRRGTCGYAPGWDLLGRWRLFMKRHIRAFESSAP
jgi:hypothetical protein